MKIYNEVIKPIFVDMMWELFNENKIFFSLASLLTVGIPFLLGNIKSTFFLLVISYPFSFLLFLLAHNYFFRVVFKCIGIRNGEIPTISKPNFPFEKVIGAKKISIIYNSNLPFKDIKNQIIISSKRIKYVKDIYYYGMISVPINAAIGYVFGQKRKVHIYNYDRTKSEWYAISRFEKQIEINVSKEKGDDNNQVNIVLPFSYPIDTSKILNNNDIIIIKIQDTGIDLDASYSLIVNQITNIIKHYQVAHFFASINNGFALYLGARLNDSNLPVSLFYEYGGSKNKAYIYSLNIKTLDKSCLNENSSQN